MNDLLVIKAEYYFGKTSGLLSHLSAQRRLHVQSCWEMPYSALMVVTLTIERFAEKYNCLLIYANKWCYIT